MGVNPSLCNCGHTHSDHFYSRVHYRSYLSSVHNTSTGAFHREAETGVNDVLLGGAVDFLLDPMLILVL